MLQLTTFGLVSWNFARISVGGFPGYQQGEEIPSLLQIFNGEPPANTDPVTVVWDGDAMRLIPAGATERDNCYLVEEGLFVSLRGQRLRYRPALYDKVIQILVVPNDQKLMQLDRQ
jgi:hypothetical protein|tara:strand:- start:192 stop:539 length:348 start_codon:yes stop_codon:yes gene_type:complete